MSSVCSTWDEGSGVGRPKSPFSDRACLSSLKGSVVVDSNSRPESVPTACEVLEAASGLTLLSRRFLVGLSIFSSFTAAARLLIFEEYVAACGEDEGKGGNVRRVCFFLELRSEGIAMATPYA